MECQECHAVFSNRANLKRHVSNIHESTVPAMECQECHAVCSTRANLKRHVLNIHGRNEPAIDESIDCPYCYAELPNPLWLGRHVETYHPVVIKMVACIQNASK